MSQNIGKCNNGIVTFGCNNLIHVFSNASLLDSEDRYITQQNNNNQMMKYYDKLGSIYKKNNMWCKNI